MVRIRPSKVRQPSLIKITPVTPVLFKVIQGYTRVITRAFPQPNKGDQTPVFTSMPGVPLSHDFRDKIVKWYHEDQETMKEIAVNRTDYSRFH